jgi:hypothetical protein
MHKGYDFRCLKVVGEWVTFFSLRGSRLEPLEYSLELIKIKFFKDNEQCLYQLLFTIFDQGMSTEQC